MKAPNTLVGMLRAVLPMWKPDRPPRELKRLVLARFPAEAARIHRGFYSAFQQLRKRQVPPAGTPARLPGA